MPFVVQFGCGQRPRYGYRVSNDGKSLVIYEPEARIIRLVFQWYVEGDENGLRLSMKGIADRLSAMQVPTWSDNHAVMNYKQRGPGQWDVGVIANILHCETYAGRWHYGKQGRHHANPKEQWIGIKDFAKRDKVVEVLDVRGILAEEDGLVWVALYVRQAKRLARL